MLLLALAEFAGVFFDLVYPNQGGCMYDVSISASARSRVDHTNHGLPASTLRQTRYLNSASLGSGCLLQELMNVLHDSHLKILILS